MRVSLNSPPKCEHLEFQKMTKPNPTNGKRERENGNGKRKKGGGVNVILGDSVGISGTTMGEGTFVF